MLPLSFVGLIYHFYRWVAEWGGLGSPVCNLPSGRQLYSHWHFDLPDCAFDWPSNQLHSKVSHHDHLRLFLFPSLSSFFLWLLNAVKQLTVTLLKRDYPESPSVIDIQWQERRGAGGSLVSRYGSSGDF